MYGVLDQGHINVANATPFGGGGWGQSAWNQIEELNKALTAGSGVNPEQFSGGRAMTYESLHSTLIQQLWSEKEAKLFRRLKSTPIGSTVYQWAERTGVGTPYGAAVAEGGASIAHDQAIGRQSATAKYYQTHRQATLQMIISSDRNMTLEEAIALETNAGALYLIQIIERALFSANSMYNPLEFDGLEAQLRAHDGGSNIIDARVRAGTENFEDKIKEASDIVRKAYGRLDSMYADVGTLTGFQDIIRSRTRYPVPDTVKTDVAGNVIFNTYPTTHGPIDLYEDLFIAADGVTDGPGNIPQASPLVGAPTAGAITAQAVSVLAAGSRPASVQSLWTSEDAGDYRYQVVAVNNLGDGPAEDGSAAATIPANVAGQVVQIACAVPGGATRPKAIKLYRTKKNAANTNDARFVKTVMVPAGNTNTTVNIHDGNEDLPGTAKVFLLSMDSKAEDGQNAIEWLQFAPMMRFNLFPASAAVWPFLVLIYGMLALFKPQRHAMIKNVIPDGLDWFD